MSDEHKVSAMREMRHIGGKWTPRWRGRCSCGAQTYMHYAFPSSAQTALHRTHLSKPTNAPERNIHD